MGMKISEIKVGRRYRKDLGDIAALAESIRNVGLLHPIVVTKSGELIAGARRLAACKKLGLTEVPVHRVDLEQMLLGESDENFQRKNFTPSEAVAIGTALEPIERGTAEARKKAHGGTAPGKKGRNTSENFSEVSVSKKSENESLARVAAAVGMSRPTYVKAKAIVEAAKKSPEKRALLEDLDRTGRVSGVFRRLKIATQVEAIRSEPAAQPDGPFRVIVVDPPWRYANRAQDSSHQGHVPYPDMSIAEIVKFGKEHIAPKSEADSVCWLWTTSVHLREAFGILEAWGFDYRTTLVWAKDKMGLGDWLRGQTEFCLLGTRGRPAWNLKNETTLLHGKRRDHSRKPNEFYEFVDRLCPGSKVEFFSREKREGWASFGDEA